MLVGVSLLGAVAVVVGEGATVPVGVPTVAGGDRVQEARNRRNRNIQTYNVLIRRTSIQVPYF